MELLLLLPLIERNRESLKWHSGPSTKWSQVTHPLACPVSFSRTWCARCPAFVFPTHLAPAPPCPAQATPTAGRTAFFLSLAPSIVPFKSTQLKLIILSPVLPLKLVYNLFQFLQQTALYYDYLYMLHTRCPPPIHGTAIYPP